MLDNVDALGFVPAYAKKKTGNVRARYGLTGIRKKPGVYFIKENGVITYVGMSRSNVQEALYRHFQTWKDKRWFANRVSYKHLLEVNTYEVAAVTTSREDAHELEKFYIRLLDPRDNRAKYEKYKTPAHIITKVEGIHLNEELETLPF